MGDDIAANVTLLLIILFLSRILTAEHQCQTVRSISNRALRDHVISVSTTTSVERCNIKCEREPDCYSINYILSSKSCELNKGTRLSHPKDFLPRENTVYIDSLHRRYHACVYPPCQNGGTCIILPQSPGYKCLCQPNYSGNHCQDIDACSNGSHDCHENATCINIAGHFNCTCQPGFTGDGRNCSDCSSNFHRFEKYQDLPTRGAMAVEQFSINGSLFLAFANYKSDTEGFNTDSFIYKLNDSTGKFSLYQTIGTSSGRNMEYFTISDRHYLAVANYYNGATYRVNSVIYQWDGQQFVFFQNISTKGASSFNFFKILKDMFLAVTNAFDGSKVRINSVIYKWNNSQFETFQEIGTERAMASAAFVINNKNFIAFANKLYSQQSTVFEWSGQQFVKLQSLQTYKALDVKSFNINGHTFLAFANSKNYFIGKRNIDSFIFKWNGSQFVHFQSIPTHRAYAWHPFVMCDQTYLGVANNRDDTDGFNTKSVVYQASGSQFSEYQNISTQGSSDMTSFEYKGHTYLAVANHINNDGKYNINSTLCKWT